MDIPDSTREAETEPAVDFIIDAVKTYSKDLVYVPTGPMTNIAAAIRKAPEIKDKIGKIVLMGGALTVCGNVNCCVEANSPRIRTPRTTCSVPARRPPMVGLDVTLQTLLTYKETQQWRDLNTKGPATSSPHMTDFYINGLRDHLAASGWLRPARSARRRRGRGPDAGHHAADQPAGGDVEGPTRGRTIGDNTRLNDPVKTCRRPSAWMCRASWTNS